MGVVMPLGESSPAVPNPPPPNPNAERPNGVGVDLTSSSSKSIQLSPGIRPKVQLRYSPGIVICIPLLIIGLRSLPEAYTTCPEVTERA